VIGKKKSKHCLNDFNSIGFEATIKMGKSISHHKNFEIQNKMENLESFALLWLDAQVDANEENRRAQKQLRNIINHLKTFNDEFECQQYISTMSPHDRVVLIVSGRLGQTIVPRIHHLRHIRSIYVYCRDKQTHEQWSQRFTKVFHLFASICLLRLCFVGQSCDCPTK
jgi:hypothetical protein